MSQTDATVMKKMVSGISCKLVFDRLSICFNEKNPESVKKTCGLIISDYKNKLIPGMHVTKTPRYHVSCTIPFATNATDEAKVCFQAGPTQPGQSSFRLDFNPSKLSLGALIAFQSHLAGWIDADDVLFFYFGKVTRCDLAVDLPGLYQEDVIVRTSRMQKHGVYSNRHGDPETTYIGTPRGRRIVAYDKPNPSGLGTRLRLECRLRPQLLGYQLATLANPFKMVQLLPANFSDSAGLYIPAQFIADSTRIGGLRRALKPLDSPRRKTLKAAYQAAQSLLPNLDALWTTWPDVLINCGLGKQLGAVPIEAYVAA